jgi:hypothetical protein
MSGTDKFRWDWMVMHGASLSPQLLLDLVAPMLIVLLFRVGRFNIGPLLEDDESNPMWLRNLWKYLLAALYVWFFSATLYDYFHGVP